MSIDEFVTYSGILHAMTVDFVRAVPDDRWDFTPDPPDRPGQVVIPGRIGVGFAPFSKQVRHVVCVRGVYNAALREGRVDWPRKHEHYTGPLDRAPLLDALDDAQRVLLETLGSVDASATLDWDGFPFTFALFTGEFIQHEAIHHGQWSVYAALGGFDTPASWHASWGL